MFAGTARLTAAAVNAGWKDGGAVDPYTGHKQLHLPRDAPQLRRHLYNAAWVHFAPPCKAWSAARTTVTRAKRAADRRKQRPLVRMVATLARRVSKRFGVFTIEHPLTSAMWNEPSMQALLQVRGVQSLRLDQCRFGARVEKSGLPTRKATRLLTNCSINQVAKRCNCTCGHDWLRGRSASASAAYPRPLCRALAEAVSKARGAD